jgi:ABC-type antimicrobial peptide transport system permease subunit
MNKIDLIQMGLMNLSRRKTRTILTVLGVVIGAAAIVIMMSLGYGMNYSFQEQLTQMGSITIIEVQPNYGDAMVSPRMGKASSSSGA